MTENTPAIDIDEPIVSNDRYRVIMQHDLHGMEPDGDVYVPQVTFEDGATLNMSGELGRELREALQRFGMGYYSMFRNRYDAFEKFERWARVFHGVNAKIFETIGYSQGDYEVIITWPNAEWRTTVGVSDNYMPDDLDVHDFSCWIWGDVYTLELQRRTTWTSDRGEVVSTWEMVDAIGGFYYRYAESDASHIREEAQAMIEDADQLAA